MFFVLNINHLLSDNCSGDSEDILIKCDKLNSDSLFRSQDLIFFICEYLLSTDAVVTGTVRQILASVLMFGYIAPISSVVVNSCNCCFIRHNGFCHILNQLRCSILC